VREKPGKRREEEEKREIKEAGNGLSRYYMVTAFRLWRNAK